MNPQDTTATFGNPNPDGVRSAWGEGWAATAVGGAGERRARGPGFVGVPTPPHAQPAVPPPPLSSVRAAPLPERVRPWPARTRLAWTSAPATPTLPGDEAGTRSSQTPGHNPHSPQTQRQPRRGWIAAIAPPHSAPCGQEERLGQHPSLARPQPTFLCSDKESGREMREGRYLQSGSETRWPTRPISAVGSGINTGRWRLRLARKWPDKGPPLGTGCR